MNERIKPGDKFGRLTAVEKTEEKSGTCYIWLCECECGKILRTSSRNLLQGRSKSCGCILAEKANKVIEKCRSIRENTYIDGTDVLMVKKNYRTGKGVSQLKSGKYKAYINFKGKHYSLGAYEKESDARDARNQAEDELFGTFLANLKEAE